jgi:hypothetical protein
MSSRSDRAGDGRLPARLVAGALYVVLMGGAWDFWWHGSLLRESFWSPPHLLIQAGVFAAIAAAVYGWRSTGNLAWGRLAVALAIIPIVSPIDNLWHITFGIEQVGTVMIFWSPPHLALLVAIVAALARAMSMVSREPDPMARTFFMSLLVAATLHVLLYYAYPLEPFGPFHLLGYAGTLVLGGILAFCLLVARRMNGATGSATMTVAFYIVLAVMQFVEKPGPGVVVAPYTYPPGWLYIFAFLIPAFAADTLPERWAPPVRGSVLGFLYAGVLYGFSSPFLPAPFQYEASSAWIAVLAGVAGGAGGGFLVHGRRWISQGRRVTRPASAAALGPVPVGLRGSGDRLPPATAPGDL